MTRKQPNVLPITTDQQRDDTLGIVGNPYVRTPTWIAWRRPGFSLPKKRDLHPPIVTMTAAENVKKWAAEIGVEAYLAKPFDLDHLLAIVASCCRI